MARLLVLRGDSLDREVPLTGQSVRLGRDPQNDVILEDPGKSVSREHAEIRFEDDRYVIVDLGSQNGVWVSGARVPYVVLEPDVVASIGPFRLTVDERHAATSPLDDSELSGTFVQTAPVAGGRLTRAGEPDPRVTEAGSWISRQPRWALGTAAAALVLGGGVAISTLIQRPDPAPEAGLMSRLQQVAALIDAGRCSTAVDAINQLVSGHPDDDEVMELKVRADACAPPGGTPPVPPGPTQETAAHLEAARRLIGTGDCPRAIREHIEVVLSAESGNVEALQLRSRAEACTTASGRETSAAASDCAAAVPPEQGGLPLATSCEPRQDYGSRVKRMNERYNTAVAVLSEGHAERALPLLEQIVTDAGERYRDVAARLGNARTAVATHFYNAAVEHETNQRWNAALESFQKAQETDRRDVRPELARVAQKKLDAGQKACAEADAAFAYAKLRERSRVEAETFYSDVLELLAADDPCYARAKERLPGLRRDDL